MAHPRTLRRGRDWRAWDIASLFCCAPSARACCWPPAPPPRLLAGRRRPLSPRPGAPSPASVAEAVDLFKTPTCGCCTGHEDYLRDAGWRVQAHVRADIEAVKQEMGIPRTMWSCHTSRVAGYFVEGHVPLAAIVQLLDERPRIDGIALPGMPAGSPGMGGVQDGPLTVFAISGGEVVGVFGEY